MTSNSDRKIGRYVILKELGKSKYGPLFRAEDPQNHTKVIVEVITQSSGDQVEFRNKFERQAQIATLWLHPGIVRILEVDQAFSMLILVKEDIHGVKLSKFREDLRAENRTLSIVEACHLLRQICLAVDYLHQQQIILGDLKPEDIIVQNSPAEEPPFRAVLTNIGLPYPPGYDPKNEGGVYVAPEVYQNKPHTVASDVYSLGVILYELLVGYLPVGVGQGASTKGTFIPLPSAKSIRPDLPDEIIELLDKALAIDPRARYSGPRQLAEKLLEVLNKTPTPTEAIQADKIYVLKPLQNTQVVLFKRDGIKIGRDLENDIVIDHPSVSREHARIDFDGITYQIRDLDSKNGTFLGDQKLTPQESTPWPANKCVKIGDAWLRLDLYGRAVTNKPVAKYAFVRPDGTLIDPDLVVFSSSEKIGLFIKDLSLGTAPGSSLNKELILINQGGEPDSFVVSISGIPTEWLPALPATISIGGDSQSKLDIIIQPRKSMETQAKRYRPVLRVASLKSPDQRVELSLSLNVLAYQQFKSRFRPEVIRANEVGKVTVANQGNSSETYKISWSNPEDQLEFIPSQANLTVPVGHEASVDYKVKDKRPRLSGVRSTKKYAITVEGPGGKREVHQADFISQPYVPLLLIAGLLSVCLILTCLFIIGYSYFKNRGINTALPTATPSITPTWTFIAIILPTNTPTSTASPTITTTATPTFTPPATLTQTSIPTNTPTYTLTPIPTNTATPTPPSTLTPTASPAATVTNTPTPTPAGGSLFIAFGSSRDGNDEIYRMRSDGTQQTNLTNNPVSDLSPSWSPGQNRIAISSNRDGDYEIFSLNPNDGSVIQLTVNTGSDDITPAWSSDGSKIAFARGGDIYSMESNGSNQINLTIGPETDSEPAWSPASNKIVFVRDGDIYVMDSDGSDQFPRTTGPSTDSHPSWSPDGQRIVFSRDGDLYQMDSDGSNLFPITTGGSVDTDPNWSSDGKQIVFARDGDIYSMVVQGSIITRLTFIPPTNRSPDW